MAFFVEPFSKLSFQIDAILQLFKVNAKEDLTKLNTVDKLKLLTNVQPNESYKKLLE
jgi:hypothetical protein